MSKKYYEPLFHREGSHPLFKSIKNAKKRLDDLTMQLKDSMEKDEQSLKFKIVLHRATLNLSSIALGGLPLISLEFTLQNQKEVNSFEKLYGVSLRKSFDETFSFRKIEDDYIILNNPNMDYSLQELIVITGKEFNELITKNILPSDIVHYLETNENYQFV